MSKIRVLSDHLANQIAAGEVVERPASVAKELVENSVDAGARRITIDIQAGGRRLLRVSDDGEGMTRDDAILAFERHATSKISKSEDLAAISTLGFRGEALASIAAVARVELLTKTEDAAAGTRVLIEGGRMRDVKDAAHPTGTTISVRDLFFNVPARRKFLRSEATESYHLTNLVTHYALAHPEIAFTLNNNGRETLHAPSARDLRERAYQIFGSDFLESLLEVRGGYEQVARVSGFVSAPRERRTSRDGQFLFINGRFVRDKLIGRALSEGYRSVLPHGVYPVALLFLDVPLEEVDVNVHPAKTEVRFRRAAAVSDAVRESVRGALASAGFVRNDDFRVAVEAPPHHLDTNQPRYIEVGPDENEQASYADRGFPLPEPSSFPDAESQTQSQPAAQEKIEFGYVPPPDDIWRSDQQSSAGTSAIERHALVSERESTMDRSVDSPFRPFTEANSSLETSQFEVIDRSPHLTEAADAVPQLPPLVSASELMREVAVEDVGSNIRPMGQLEESFIIATDDEGLLLIDQHVAHERILFDKFRKLESSRQGDSQNLLIPETFDLTPAQAAAFDAVADELESYGFGLMRLSGRTVAIKAVPADLPAGEARNMLSEVLDTIDSEKRGVSRETLRDEIAASLACKAAIKINMPLAVEKMRWLIDRLLLTSSPTTCPHGRPVILRLTVRDIEKGFHRPQKGKK